MASDLELAFNTLNEKLSPYNDLFAYYDGDQPLVYTATRLKDIFKDLNAYFAENWCSVVVDSAKDRINLRSIQVAGPAGKAWQEIYERSEIGLEADEIHEAAMVTGEGYFIAWPDEAGRMEGYANDPRLVHLFYDSQYPRKKRFGAKWWKDDDGYRRMTLYYADRLEYYQSTVKDENVQSWQQFKSMSAPAANQYGAVPVFHYRVAQRRAKSDLKNVIPVQNGVNKLLTDMMVVAEYAAFPQRYIISNVDTQGKLKNAPNQVWDLPAGDGIGQQTMAGQFPAADLKNYLDAIDNLATAISSITRTPKHYFFSVGSNLSGEALIAMESPLNKKAQDRIDRFAPVWKQVTQFMLQAAGQPVDTEQIEVNYDRPETVQPRTTAETRQMSVMAGMPLTSVLRDEGKSEAYIKQVLKDIAEAERKKADLASAYLEQARRNFDQNVNGGGNAAVQPAA